MKQQRLLAAGMGSALVLAVLVPLVRSPRFVSAVGQAEPAVVGEAVPAVREPGQGELAAPVSLPAAAEVVRAPLRGSPVYQGGYEGMPGYPPPGPVATVPVPSPGVYEGMSAMEVALAMVEKFEANGWAIAPTTVITAVDLYANNRGGILIAPSAIKYGGEPDVVFILQGKLRAWWSGDMDRWVPYVIGIADRGRGGPYFLGGDTELSRLLDLLP